MFTIRATATGVEILDAQHNVVASFEGTLEVAYADAVAHLAGLVPPGFVDERAEDDGLLPERWTSPGPIAFRAALPGGRDFSDCDWTWRATPIALMLQTKNLPQHQEAELAGFADDIWLDENGEPWATGRFYNSPAGEQARDTLKGGRSFGVSVDPSENISVEDGCGEWVEDELFGSVCAQPLAIFKAYEIAGITMVPFPGFEDAKIALATDDSSDDTADDGETEVPDTQKLTQASANYDATGGDAGHQCSDCIHFLDVDATDGDSPACEIVQDPIVPAGVCDHFEAASDEEEDDDSGDETDDSQSGPNDMPGMAVEWADGWALDKITQGDRDKYGMEDGSYPVKSCGTGPGSVQSAVHAVGRGGSDHDAIRKHIMSRAKALGCSDQIPDNWSSDGSIKASAAPAVPLRAWFEMPEPKLGEVFEGDLLGDDVLVPQYDIVRDAGGRFQRWGDRVLGYAVPFTITADRRVYGHLTYWGQCHVGNPWGAGRCASASPSQNGYADFYGSGTTGPLDDGSELSCGLLHVGCEHSSAMDVRGVRDAAAHAGLAFAKVRVMDGEYGPWYCGMLLPTVTDDQIDALRALVLSGEWVPELGAVIAVNDGGFPQQRRDRIAASNGNVFVVAHKISSSSVKDGKLAKLVGGTTVRPCPECQKRARAARESKGPNDARLAALEAQMDMLLTGVGTLLSRTAHLNVAAASDLSRQLSKDEE